MKILKKLLLGISIIIAGLLIAAIFIPNEYKITHTVAIQKPQKEVYDYVKMLGNQKEWSTFMEADPNVKITYSGKDGAVGATQYWKGNDDVGEGSQKIIRLDGERIDVELHFIKPFEGINRAGSIIKPINSSSCTHTEVFYGSESYPKNLLNIPMKMMLEEYFIKNGNNLKKRLENK